MFPIFGDSDVPISPWNYFEAARKFTEACFNYIPMQMLYWNGMAGAHRDFILPYMRACRFFGAVESDKLPRLSLEANLHDYAALIRFTNQIIETGLKSSFEQFTDYHEREFRRYWDAALNCMLGSSGETIDQYVIEKLEVLERLVVDYPDAIREVASEFGFHLDSGKYAHIAETDRMTLYQVLPTHAHVEVRMDLKPVIIVHPYVLGAGILAFLPNEDKSYVHAFANQGIPTYIRLVKDITETPAVQTMSGEDDARDTAFFAKIVKDRHDKPCTLNGFCQGGFISLLDVLSGELDGLVDALITCVAPLDGTRSRGLVEYLEHITPRFRDLVYAEKLLANGARVVDGQVMSWVYKLKSIEREAPLFTYYRDISLFEKMGKNNGNGINKTAAAINHWLMYDRTDLPVEITQLSFKSYTIPITANGRLPVALFGRKLNLDYIREKNIRFQICYAAKDDLVDTGAALAPADFVEVELTQFPKGHAAIATSWSDPESEYALHKVFPDDQRGPVRFQLDLNEK